MTCLSRSFIVAAAFAIAIAIDGSAVHANTFGLPIFINAGGENYTDSGQNLWVSDAVYNFHNGTGFTDQTGAQIDGTTDVFLYQTDRWDPSEAPVMDYRIPIANGEYQIKLHFAEIYGWEQDFRVFNVSIEDILVLEDFDILEEVPRNTALIKEFNTTVGDGELLIRFIHNKDNPKVNAIEIHEVVEPGTLMPSLSSQPSNAPSFTPPVSDFFESIYINVGGDNYTDGGGILWVADEDYSYHNTGFEYFKDAPISGTTDDLLYQSDRWDSIEGPEMEYRIPAPNGMYQVKLHFAEIYATVPGQRIFSVAIGGVSLLSDFDILAEVGPDSSLVKEFNTMVTRNEVYVKFFHQVENPKVNAIEVHRVEDSGPASQPSAAPSGGTPISFNSIYINAGGGNYTDGDGIIWVSDGDYNYHDGSGFVDSSNAVISGTTSDVLYQSDRWDPPEGPVLEYRIPVPDGNYQIKLHFAEIYAFDEDFRVFNVFLEESIVLENFDILMEVPRNTALVREFNTSVTDGELLIEFLHNDGKNNPKISAIEIHAIDSSPVSPTTPSPSHSQAPSAGFSDLPSALPTKSSAPSAAFTFQSIFINAGGTSYTDVAGNLWLGDEASNYYNVGNVASTSFDIANTADDFLYKAERWDMLDAPEMEYRVPVSNGDYQVKLHFAEIYTDLLGFRVFSVSIEGSLVLTNFDILSEVPWNTALVKVFDATVTDGDLLIQFFHIEGKDNPKISAIEIHGIDRAPAIPTTPGPSLSMAPSTLPSLSIAPSLTNGFQSIYINAGGANYTDDEDRIWVSDDVDNYYNLGNVASTDSDIEGTTNDALYKSERWDWPEAPEMEYRIRVPNGNYHVVLHFAEIYADVQDFRVFDVVLEGTVVLTNFDILSEVPKNFAVSKAFNVTVGDEELLIQFMHVEGKDNPKISAIEIHASDEFIPDVPATSGPSLSLSPSTVSAGPSKSALPSGSPSSDPSREESVGPTLVPSNVPSVELSIEPSLEVSLFPSHVPTKMPSSAPSATAASTVTPTTVHPSESPSLQPGLTLVPSASPTGGTAPPFNPIRINSGGEIFTDSKGNDWVADQYFNPGSSPENTGVVIQNIPAADSPLYQKGRWSAELQYQIPIDENGIYVVTLHFAEIFSGAQDFGLRVFNVSIQGDLAFESVDIYAAVRGYTPYQLSTTVPVTNNEISIQFEKEIENPKVSGIEITMVQDSGGGSLSPSLSSSPTQAPTQIPSTYRVNIGGEEFIDQAGAVWEADRYSNIEGSIYSVSDPISGTEDDELYKTDRWGAELAFEFPLQNGDYAVTMYFAEIYFGTQFVGARIFNISLENGLVVLDNIDIFEQAGGYAAWNISKSVTISDNGLSVSFDSIADNPKISAIRIEPLLLLTSPPISVGSSGPSASFEPSLAPSGAPSTIPSNSMQPSPQLSNIPSTAPSGVAPFSPYHINVGGPSFIDKTGTTWEADGYNVNGGLGNTNEDVSGTNDPFIYQSERWGSDLGFEIPVPNGDYEVTLHFAEIYFRIDDVGQRIFNVTLEGQVEFDNVDIYDQAGGPYRALQKLTSVRVIDESLSVGFEAIVQNPKISGIQIAIVGHYAHAVPGGPYLDTDTDNDGFETVVVDGTFSHTHGPGASLTSSRWIVNGAELAQGLVANITFGVGNHTLILEVSDTGGDVHQDFTTVTVRPFGYPAVAYLIPPDGDVSGGDTVLIEGSGFSVNETETVVHFGMFDLSGPAEIEILSDTLLRVISTPTNFKGQVDVTVETPVGTSNVATYEYVNYLLPPVTFKKGTVMPFIYGPSSLAVGPDGKLYVANVQGKVYKLTLDDQHQVIETVMSDVIEKSEEALGRTRTILGITFDPLDTSTNPKLYVAHSYLFHGELESYNGKISTLSGTNLTIMEDLVTGLPVSDHDHAVNGLEFGDNGELYIQIGGNTNAGVPGYVSQSGEQDENFFSAATLVAYNITLPSFDGNITYTNGIPISGFDVHVFAPGMRNPYDIVLHSNGYLYGTDNGANNEYGDALVNCTDSGWNPDTDDRLLLIEKDSYYGSPNLIRAINGDPRQCTFDWYNIDNYVATIERAVTGITEFQGDHFAGQLRGHLILGRYQGALYDATLSSDGKSTVNNVAEMVTDGGLDVIQGPDGTLYVAQNFKNKVLAYQPDELTWLFLKVKSVFPRRGASAGGTNLTVYGENFLTFGTPNVTVGGSLCPLVDSVADSKLICLLPAGSGSSDVVVSAGQNETYEFVGGYRFISGVYAA